MSSRDCVRTASVQTHARSKPRPGAVGQLVIPAGNHDQLVGTVDALVLKPVAGVGARQTTQREQPRHETHLGVRVARGDELVDLVELREVSASLGRAFSARGRRDVWQVDTGDQLADGHEPSSFTFHTFVRRPS